MKKVVSLLLVISMLFVMAISLVSCGEPKDEGARIDVYLGSGVYDFDPTDYYVDSNAEQFMSLLFEPLFKYEKGKVKGAMAEEYVINSEDRTIIITLRESYWSNGTRVKAADFVYSWAERLLAPENANPAAALLYDIENASELKSGKATPADLMVEATDVYELKITYREGGDPEQLIKNLASVATAPIREPSDKSTIGYWSKSPATIVSNGPFRMASYSVASGEITLERNKGYHQSPDIEDYDNEVRPGAIVALTTPLGEQIEVSYADITSKTVFYLSDAPLAERSSGKVKTADHTSVYTYVFNTNNPLFKDVKVRTALSMAVDREAIIAAITYGKAADGFVPDVSGGSTEALISTKADLTAARKLISEANITAAKKFTLTISDDAESVAIAEIVVKAWADLGFEVTVNKVTTATTTIGSGPSATNIYDSAVQQSAKLAGLGETNFDVIALDWQTYTDDAFVALASLTTGLNGCGTVLPEGKSRTSISGWSDTKYDGLVASAFAAQGKDRAGYLAEAEAYLCQQMPVMPLVFNQNAAFVAKGLSKISFNGFGNVVFTDAKQKSYHKYLDEDEQ